MLASTQLVRFHPSTAKNWEIAQWPASHMPWIWHVPLFLLLKNI